VFQSGYKAVFGDNPSAEDDVWWKKIHKLTKLVKIFIREEVTDDVSMASDLTEFSEVDDSFDEEGGDDGVNDADDDDDDDDDEGLHAAAPVVEDDEDPYSFLTGLDPNNPRIPAHIYLFGVQSLTAEMFSRVANDNPVNYASDIFTRTLSRKVQDGYNNVPTLARVRRLYDCQQFLFLLNSLSNIPSFETPSGNENGNG
jgi:hypothetical protein